MTIKQFLTINEIRFLFVVSLSLSSCTRWIEFSAVVALKRSTNVLATQTYSRSPHHLSSGKWTHTRYRGDQHAEDDAAALPPPPLSLSLTWAFFCYHMMFLLLFFLLLWSNKKNRKQINFTWSTINFPFICCHSSIPYVTVVGVV